MSEQQFLRMHPGHKGEAIEWNGLTLRNIPVAEATILIKLPAEFRLDGEPWLSITDQDDRANQRLQDVYRAHLVFNSQTNIIFLRLPYPPLGLIYKINWQLRDEPPPVQAGCKVLMERRKRSPPDSFNWQKCLERMSFKGYYPLSRK